MPQQYDKNNPLMTSAEILLGSQAAVSELGGDLAELLDYCGLSLAQVEAGEGYVPLHQVVSFLNHAAASLDCEYFGLLLAKHQPPARFGMVGQLLRFCSTLGEAINDAIQFSVLNSQYSLWHLHKGEQTTALIRQVRVNIDQDVTQMQTLAIAVVYKAMSALCQRKIKLAQVTFSHRQPSAHDRVQGFFNAPILYDQPLAGLVISSAELGAVIPTANPDVYALLVSYLEDIAATRDKGVDVVERLRAELRQSMGSRHCTLDGICQRWGAHPRGLQRRLRECGTSFRDVLQDVRQELAESYLRHSSIAVLELADMLGYRNASAFSRAFKQRSGLAPDHWRMQRNTTQVS